MIKKFCDRCGTEILDYNHGGAELDYRKNVEGYEGLATKCDLCMECYSELLKLIKNATIKERKDL